MPAAAWHQYPQMCNHDGGVMVRTQIQLTEEQAVRIKQVAKESHISMAEVIRQGIDAFLRSAATVEAKDRVNRALEAAGRYRSGRRNGSSRHNLHLAEAYKL
jgi:Arc/MetJ-type ribon-helix-helix transcriptional regulator